MVAVLMSVILFYLLICGYVYAYYGDPYGRGLGIPALERGVSVALKDEIYILGGNVTISSYSLFNGRDWTVNILRFHPTTKKASLRHYSPRPQEVKLNRDLSHAYALGDNNTIVLVNVQYPFANVTNAQSNSTIELETSGIAFHNTSNLNWIYPQLNTTAQPLPPLRKDFMSAISPENDAIYVMGGYYSVDDTPITDIFRYDLKNTSSIINMTAVDANLKIDRSGASSQMLP